MRGGVRHQHFCNPTRHLVTVLNGLATSENAMSPPCPRRRTSKILHIHLAQRGPLEAHITPPVPVPVPASHPSPLSSGPQGRETPARDHTACSPPELGPEAWRAAGAPTGTPACAPACDGLGAWRRRWGWAGPSPAEEANGDSQVPLPIAPPSPTGPGSWAGDAPTAISSTQALTLRGLGEVCGEH